MKPRALFISGELICKSKLAYDSEELAQGGADFDLKIYGNKMYVYKCRFCPKYHLTSKSYVFINKKKVKIKKVPKAKPVSKKKVHISAPWRKSYMIQVINWKKVPGDMKEPKITFIK